MDGASGTWPRPFAVGVLALDGDPADDDQRRRERLDLALDAYTLGYFLIDTIEVTANGVGYSVAETLAARTGADAYVVRGSVDHVRLKRSADRLRLTVRSLSRQASGARADQEAHADQGIRG